MSKTKYGFDRKSEYIIRKSMELYMVRGTVLSVSEICQHANISRSSFYNHFSDFMDLVEACKQLIQKVVEEYIGYSLEALRGAHEILNDQEVGVFFGATIRRLVRFAREEQEIFRVLQIFKNNPTFATSWISNVKSINAFGARVYEAPEAVVPYYVSFCFDGLNAALTHWIDGGFRETEAEMVTILEKLVPYNEMRAEILGSSDKKAAWGGLVIDDSREESVLTKLNEQEKESE